MNRQPMLGGNGFAVSRNLNPNLVRVESLKPLGRETRKHPPSQIRKLQASIEQLRSRRNTAGSSRADRATRTASRKASAILAAMSNGRSRFPSGSMNREGRGGCRLR
jgi:hypothetical protein